MGLVSIRPSRPGWYPDADDPDSDVWWDGQAWTDRRDRRSGWPRLFDRPFLQDWIVWVWGAAFFVFNAWLFGQGKQATLEGTLACVDHDANALFALVVSFLAVVPLLTVVRTVARLVRRKAQWRGWVNDLTALIGMLLVAAVVGMLVIVVAATTTVSC